VASTPRGRRKRTSLFKAHLPRSWAADRRTKATGNPDRRRGVDCRFGHQGCAVGRKAGDADDYSPSNRPYEDVRQEPQLVDDAVDEARRILNERRREREQRDEAD
jgi:hypothetical protein